MFAVPSVFTAQMGSDVIVVQELTEYVELLDEELVRVVDRGVEHAWDRNILINVNGCIAPHSSYSDSFAPLSLLERPQSINSQFE